MDQSPLSVSSCRSHSGSCTRSRKCQLSPHAPQTTVFPSASVWPPAVRRNSSLSRREAVCWQGWQEVRDRKSTRLNSSHLVISYAVFCLKKKKKSARCTSCRCADYLSTTG